MAILDPGCKRYSKMNASSIWLVGACFSSALSCSSSQAPTDDESESGSTASADSSMDSTTQASSASESTSSQSTSTTSSGTSASSSSSTESISSNETSATSQTSSSTDSNASTSESDTTSSTSDSVEYYDCEAGKEGIEKCRLFAEYCRVSGDNEHAECEAIPAECLPQPTCECLLEDRVDEFRCDVNADGRILIRDKATETDESR